MQQVENILYAQGPGARGPGRGGRGGRGEGPMGGPGSLVGGPSHAQLNGTSASAIHALPTSLPGQSSSSALTQKLASTQDLDTRRTMLGESKRCSW